MDKKKKSTPRKSSEMKRPKIMIGMGTCGMGAGAKGVLASIEKELKKQKQSVDLIRTGCIGMCSHEVLVDVILPGRTRVTYSKVKPDIVPQILEEHIGQGKVVKKYALSQMPHNGKGGRQYKGLPFFDDLEINKSQFKLVTKNCGIIDPDSIDEYITRDGYKALKKVLALMSPKAVIDEVSNAGLRGRGGGGSYSIIFIGVVIMAVAVIGFVLFRRKPVTAPVRVSRAESRRTARTEAKRIEARSAHRPEAHAPVTVPGPARAAPAAVPGPGTGVVFCSHCGTKLAAGAAFCHACGNKAGGSA